MAITLPQLLDAQFQLNAMKFAASNGGEKLQLPARNLRQTSKTWLSLFQSTYRYNPLREDHGEIRLVRLLPGVGRGKIHCHVEHFRADYCPPYSAVSYVWGETKKPVQIVVNKHNLHVTTNLEAFLRQARSSMQQKTWKCDWLWIDAICINQIDIDERNRQIQKMKSIFETARNIIVWLGPSSEELETAISMIKYFVTVLRRNGKRASDPAYQGPEDNLYTQKDWSCLAAFLDLSWFCRAWCLQEGSSPLSASKIKIWCGVHVTSFAALHTTTHVCDSLHREQNADCLGNHLSNLPLPLHSKCLRIVNLGIQRTLRAADQPSKRHRVSSLDLIDLLDIARRCQVHDPKDQIFSIISLAEDAIELGIVADYTKSVRSTYIEACHKIINCHGNFDIFLQCQFMIDRELPSWVPDWTAETVHACFPRTRRLADDTYGPVYNASSHIRPQCQWDLSEGIIKVNGLIVDKVIGACRPLLHFTEDTTLATEWFDFATQDRPSIVDGIVAIKTLEHTLCADVNHFNPERISRGCFQSVPQRSSHEQFPDNWFRSSHCVFGMTRWRRLVRISKGYLGLAPSEADIGDIIVLLFGGQMPLVLRKEEDHYILIGACYVHGIMDGEALADIDLEVETSVFEIW